MGKLAYILIDGLNEFAARSMRFSEKMRVPSRGGFFQAAWPPMSKPAYVTLFTGMDPYIHGIDSNASRKTAPFNNLFRLAQNSGLTTAAASYYWFYELFNNYPFNLFSDRFCANKNWAIMNGIFYKNDSYPDAELFADAESLRKSCKPEFLLAHCMGADFAGHLYGGNSIEYLEAARNIDALLADWLPILLADGYHLVVTSDHGMDDNGRHEDDNAKCRNCAFWLLGEKWENLPLPTRANEIMGLLASVLNPE